MCAHSLRRTWIYQLIKFCAPCNFGFYVFLHTYMRIYQFDRATKIASPISPSRFCSVIILFYFLIAPVKNQFHPSLRLSEVYRMGVFLQKKGKDNKRIERKKLNQKATTDGCTIKIESKIKEKRTILLWCLKRIAFASSCFSLHFNIIVIFEKYTHTHTHNCQRAE